ncbi:MAG: hypothetical protein RBQ72_02780 [Desulfobacterium sp.]|nr:hypothetical protein [Desulfobacterium sp.]
MPEEQQTEVKQETVSIPFSEFLESIPPSTLTEISDLTETDRRPSGYESHKLLTPEIQLHCPDDACNGTRFFRCKTSQPSVKNDGFSFFYISYICSNCRKTEKTFSLAARRDEDADSGKCYKFGELPVYGPPTSSRLIKLIGPDRETFLQGRRCENQGLGIGAFVYYRRVVENQKNRILDEIIKVANKLNVDAGTIAVLEAAKRETQFSKSLASVKDAMPQALLINGHNYFIRLSATACTINQTNTVLKLQAVFVWCLVNCRSV